MKRFCRRLFNGLAVLALPACVGSCILLVYSHYASDQIRIFRKTGKVWYLGDASLRRDTIAAEFGYSPPVSLPAGFFPQSGFWHGPPVTFYPLTIRPWRHLGVSFDYSGLWHYRVSGAGWFLSVSLWLPIILSAVYLILWRFVRTRCQAIPDDYCAVCGYDLRATPNRCPECGTQVSKKVQS